MADIFDMTDTWNAGATTFTAIKMNVTDTASAAGSLLMDLQVGGSSMFGVRKDGSTYIVGSINAHFINNSNGGGLACSNAGVNDDTYDAVYCGYGIRFDNACTIGWSSTTTVNPSGGSPDLILQRDAADTLAQRRGTNPQAFRLYNTYTDASNYERGFMQWSSDVLRIGTEAAGTGTQRNLLISGGHNAPSGFIMQNGVTINYRSLGFNPGAPGTSEFYAGFYAVAANVLELFGSGASVGGAFELKEMTAPSAPSSNRVRIYAEDDGAGKTRLMALFATGAAQQIAIEP